jgi:hypothetical protein
MQDFITGAGITMTSKPADNNPNMDNSAAMHHWRCTLKAGRSRWTVPFSMGSALLHEPTSAEVLDCLASDASGYENAHSFEDWCSDYGYDTDSRKAERTYRVLGQQAHKLKKLLGGSAYETLLWNTERL